MAAQAEAWQSVFEAHQTALIRLSIAEAQQEAAARHWRLKYQQALKTPECQKWASMPVQCPVQ